MDIFIAHPEQKVSLPENKAASVMEDGGPRERVLMMDKSIMKVGRADISGWGPTTDELVKAWREAADKNVSMKGREVRLTGLCTSN